MRASLALLVMMLCVSVCAQDAPDDASHASDPPSNLLALSVSLPAQGVLFYEHSQWAVGPYESAVGVEASWDGAGARVVPYGTVAYYGARTSVTVEVFLPRLAPFLGSPDRVVTLTTTYRW